MVNDVYHVCYVHSPIPHLHSEIEVSVFHHGVLSDDFLGYATIPLWEQKIQDKPKTQSVQVFLSLSLSSRREAGGSPQWGTAD